MIIFIHIVNCNQTFQFLRNERAGRMTDALSHELKNIEKKLNTTNCM